MDIGYGNNRCQQQMGHSDWSFHFLGVMATVETAREREKVIRALESAKRLYGLPLVAQKSLDDLIYAQMDAATPF